MTAHAAPQTDDIMLVPQLSTSHLPPIQIVALTVKQAAQILHVSERSIWNFIERGHIQPVKFGRTTRILSDELMEFMRTGTEKVKADVIEALANAD
jgi:excisionase family DNA binding protein